MRHIIITSAAILAAACSTPNAVAEPAEAPRTLTVTGEGRALAAPDMAVVTIGVATDGADAAAALRANSSAMKATIDKLKSMDIAARDIQTANLSVHPKYDYEKNRSQPEIIGFRASNTVRVRLRDLDKAGAVIDEAVSSGANSLGGITFTFADPKPLYNTARRDAVADARARAELLADAAGVNLGPVLTIHDGYAATPQPRAVMGRMSLEAADASVPIETGESTISAHVTLVYEIK